MEKVNESLYTGIKTYDNMVEAGRIIVGVIKRKLINDGFCKASEKTYFQLIGVEQRRTFKNLGVQLLTHHYSSKRMYSRPIIRRFSILSDGILNLKDKKISKKIDELTKILEDDWTLYIQEEDIRIASEKKRDEITNKIEKQRKEVKLTMEEYCIDSKKVNISYDYSSINIGGLNKDKVIKLLKFYKKVLLENCQ